MRIPMLVPVTTGSPATPSGPDPVVDLKVALRLLSGSDCERDPSQAQLLLLRLAEGKDRLLAEDAGRIIKAGRANGWFAETVPKQYELERIAERSLSRGDTARKRQLILVAAGLALALAFGVQAFILTEAPDASMMPMIMVAMVILGILALLVAKKTTS